MNWTKTNILKNNLALRLLPLIVWIFIINDSYGQCYRFDGQELTFNALGQNSDSTYSTTYILTDYQGIILDTSGVQSFGIKSKGLYKIYGVNFAIQSGINHLLIGSSIDSLSGECLAVSEPFETLVCLNPHAACQTYDGTYSFESAGGNANLSTVYVLTDVQQTIIQISDTTYFGGMGTGEYLIFPINYSQINHLEVGRQMHELSGICYNIGNPIFIKSCQTCFVNAGSDIELCVSQTIHISAMGSGPGTYLWSNGQSGRSIYFTPMGSTTLEVTFTDNTGCTATDEININISGSPVADGGENQTINCGEEALLSALGVRDATYRWSGGQTSQSITVSPKQTTTYYVTVTVGDCYSVDEVTIFVHPINEPISGDTLICSGQTTTLYACDGTSYIWSTNDTTSFINVNPATTQTYSVTVTKSNGCISVDQITIYVKICGKIGDLVWDDSNGNGIQDNNEPGISEVEIVLYKDGVEYETTYTDPSGRYIFTYLEPADYVVRFITPTGYVATGRDIGSNDFIDSDFNPITGLTPTYAVTENYTNYTIDGGYYRKAAIGDLVWEDRNRNGLKDELETGIENIEVRLDGNDGSGNPVELITSTDDSGKYIFSNLNPGQYSVTFIKPEEYTYSPQDIGTDETKDSDADPISGSTSLITLRSGEEKLWIDAGMYRCAQVGDYVWLDMGSIPNVQDSGDVGLDGIVVQLYSASNPVEAVQTVVTFTRNGRSGYYHFEVCSEGGYFIKVLKPDDYNFVTPNAGDGTNDSKIRDLTASTTNVFMINYGEQINTMDIGFSNKPLPVTLLDFTGYWDSEKDVNDLNWVTILEINNEYFDIERSYNGREYEKIGSVAGQGNSVRRQDYMFIDEDISLDGMYWYRLRQVDYNGAENYSKPVRIDVKRYREPTIHLYPNPTFSSSAIEVSGNEGTTYELSIYDDTGKLIKKVNENNKEGIWKYEIDARDLPRGIYHLLLNVDGKSTTLKWIVIE